MKVAGFGFRRGATVDSLVSALDAAGGREGVSVLATVEDKCESEVFRAFATRLAVPFEGVVRAQLAEVVTLTQSEASLKAYGCGSVAEASALACAGASARLIAARAVSEDRLATCAIAVGVER